MTGRSFLMAAGALAGALAAGCAHDLDHTISDEALSHVPPPERAPVSEAERDVKTARDEQAYAAAQLDAADKELSIAAKEKEQAEAEVEKRKLESEMAEASGNADQRNAANRGKAMAGMQIKEAEAHDDYVRLKKSWLKLYRDAADKHVEAARARVEWEKAKLVQQKGMRPTEDFNVAEFELQWKERDESWQATRKEAEASERETKEAEGRWKALAEQHKKIRS